MSIISSESLAIVNATKGVVAENAVKITSAFYPKMFSNNPEVLKYFNESNQRGGAQPRALADSIVAYAVNIEKLENLNDDVLRIAHKHCALNIQAEDYQIVHDNLMGAIGEVLGEAVTPEIGAAWSEAVMALAKIFIKVEGDMYQKAANALGGWNGKREFQVAAKKTEAEDVVSLTLKPSDGKPVMEHIVGQYITVCVNPTGKKYFAPRHYTLTSPPNTESYTITTKALKDGDYSGIVSNFLVNEVKVGDKVDIFPPFGQASLTGDPKRPAVFISSGIGITPWANMIPLAVAERPKVVLFHADSSPKTHALRKQLERDLGGDSAINYSYSHPAEGKFVTEGRLDIAKVTNFLASKGVALDSADFFLSMKPEASVGMAVALKEEGAKFISANEFGPHKHH